MDANARKSDGVNVALTEAASQIRRHQSSQKVQNSHLDWTARGAGY
jgi:hypothetical protein